MSTGRITSPSGSGAQATESASRARDGGRVEVEAGAAHDGRFLSGWRGMPPARWTCSMCTSGRLGDTLQIFGVVAEISFRRSSLNGIPAECASASACRMVLVDPPMAISSTKALTSACSVTISSGRTFCVEAPLQRVRGFLGELDALGVQLGRAPAVRPTLGRNGSVAGQRQADRLAQAVHRIRGEHAGAASAAGAGALGQRAQLRLGHLAHAVLAHAFEHGDQVRVARRPPASARRSRRPPGC